MSAARNIGINNSEDVDNLLFLDSDDCIEISFLNKIFTKKIDLSNFMIIGSYLEKNHKKHTKLTRHFNKDYELNNVKLEKYLDKYLLQPNKYSIFSRCWAKIYSTKYINGENNIRFNENMNTFEDVDFNFRYIRKNPKILYLDNLIYTHHIPDDLLSNSATFGSNKKISNMFSFLWAMRSAKLFISNTKIIDNNLKLDHCSGVLSVIQFIRVAGRIKSLKSFLYIYSNIKSILDRNIFTKILKNYDSNKAKGNNLLAFLLKNRLYFIALLWGKILFLKRYKFFIK